ncbi:hypothetical protein [Rhizobium mongolense]|uniref:Uncharacterized protein n=1 Tax=Rhizobium mongolense TaxID=57676 RepID=A0A7W6RRI8_9HYPH|nr:hypothetical protein [Rhizobium mongolense]MBB4277244.1 hypothetical protein [Rhizobium mongolense]
MANDLINRPDWSVAAVDTIAGGSYGAGSVFDTPAAVGVPADLPASLVAEWSRKESGGVGFRLGVAQNAAGTILGGLLDEQRQDLVAAVDSLPEGVRTVIFEELAQGTSGYVRDASAAEVNAFAASAVGNQLVREWGGRAAKRVATFHKRADRMLNAMTNDGFGWFMARFTTLDSEQLKAVIRELAR